MLSKDEFIQKYIVTFLATITAQKYASCCASGNHKELSDHAVIDDAITLAGDAWAVYNRHVVVPAHIKTMDQIVKDSREKFQK